MFAILKLVFIGKSADDKVRVMKFASVFSNCGFMGFPFLQSLFSHNVELLSELWDKEAGARSRRYLGL